MVAESSKFGGYAVVGPPNGAISPKFIGYTVIKVPTSSSKFIGYAVVKVPTSSSKFIGYAVISPGANTGGPIGSATTAAPTGFAPTIATGPIGSATTSIGGAEVDVSGNVSFPSVTTSVPIPSVSNSVTAPIGHATTDTVKISFAQNTQVGFLDLIKWHPNAAVTAMGLQALGKNVANARVTQMGLLVLAKGGEGPIQPDPLSLHDAGRSPVLRQRFVNMYPEPTPQGPSSDARYQRPGLYQAGAYGGGPIQLVQHWIGSDPTSSLDYPATDQFLITVSGGNVFRDTTNIGTIDPNRDPTWFPLGRRVRSGQSNTQFMIASNGKLYSVALDSVEQVATASSLPAGVRDVNYLAGRFIYVLDDDSGQVFYSDLGDGTSIDPLSFFTVSEDKPLPCLAVWDLSDDLCFFTTETVEFWYASADPNNPYQRSTGRRYNKGLLAIDSVELIDNALFWLGHDRQIYRTSFIYPLKISNFDVDDRIRRLTDDEVQQCYAYGVTYGGHNFYVIHLMSQGTWAYDIASKTWAEWKTWQKERFRVFCSDDTFRVYGDYFSGMLMGMDGGIFTDVNELGLQDPIERICSTYFPLQKGRHINFNLILHCTRGVGTQGDPTAFGANPVVEMRWSDHENSDFSPWLPAYLGAAGNKEEGSKSVWYMLGGMSPPGRLYEFRCTEPVFFAPYKVRVDEERP